MVETLQSFLTTGRRLVPGAFALGLWLFATAPARGQSAENVLVVINDASPASVQVGEYYARKRGIPPEHLLRIKTDTQDQIAREVFERQIQDPIATWLGRNSAHDRILYIVLTKGIPLRVGGTEGRQGTIASVDSELTLTYRKMSGRPVSTAGPVENPYYLDKGSIAQAQLFTHEAHDIFLVSRLDGFTVADVMALIDRGASPVRTGRILLDQKRSWLDKANDWLREASDNLRTAGFADRVVLETTDGVLSDEKDVLGYYSWGSNDPAIKTRHLNLRFVPGAIAGMFVSTDARTFREPPAEWNIGTWNDKKTYFDGSPQSMAGDLIREGVTGVAGHVTEPFLDATIRPQILFPAYASGFNLVESYYLAMPYLSWQTVVIGDPLCAPFKTKVLQRSQIERGIDPGTELPVFFAARRLRFGSDADVKSDVLKLMLRAEVRLIKQDRPGARQALEEATALDSRINAAHLLLASMYEETGEFDKAIDRYRQVLTTEPDQVVTLNNLAYALAVRRNQPGEALPLAQKAYTLSRGNPLIADTLGWIYHLNGDDRQALKLLTDASKGSPKHPDIRLHAAVVYAALGQNEDAARELARAIEIEPRLNDSEEVKKLRAKLKGTR